LIDHSSDQVYKDAVMCYQKLNDGGIILFDDYIWDLNGDGPKPGVDKFVNENIKELSILFINYQYCIQKKSNILYDVYCVCWNEDRLMSRFLAHYKDARKIIVMDNESNDSSRDIVKAAGRDIKSYSTNNTFDDTTNINMKNQMWKESIGKVDYVIIQDLDEFVYFPNQTISEGLTNLKNHNVIGSFVNSYRIICSDEEFQKSPVDESPINYLHKGVKEGDDYRKPMIFNPGRITETNFIQGQHQWKPIISNNGLIINPGEKLTPLMFHYKNIGEEWEIERRKIFRERMSATNRRYGMGIQYMISDEQIKNYVKINHALPRESFLLLINPDMLQVNTKLYCGNQEKTYYLVKNEKSDAIMDLVRSGKIWEPTIAETISYLSSNNLNTTFIDIGSNVGIHSINSIIGGAKYIYTFECHPVTYLKLQKNLNVNACLNIDTITNDKIFIYQTALSNKTGEEYEFCEVEGNIGASYIVGNHILNNGKKQEWKVKSSIFDSYNILGENLLIKMDIEGHEYQALEGMTNILMDTRLKVIILEFNPSCCSVKTLNDIVDLLLKNGLINYRLLHNVPRDTWAGEPSMLFNQPSTSWNEAFNEISNKFPKITETELRELFNTSISEIIFWKNI
jgi:FkbM family methyltransferase